MKNKKWRVFLSKLSSGYHLFHCILFYTDGYSRCQQVNGFICIGIQHLADIHCLLYTRHCYRTYIICYHSAKAGIWAFIKLTYSVCEWEELCMNGIYCSVFQKIKTGNWYIKFYSWICPYLSVRIGQVSFISMGLSFLICEKCDID